MASRVRKLSAAALPSVFFSARTAAEKQTALPSRARRTGKIKHSLILHPDDTHIIYPLGSTIVIKNVEDTTQQTFLQGAPSRLQNASHTVARALDEHTWPPKSSP